MSNYGLEMRFLLLFFFCFVAAAFNTADIVAVCLNQIINIELLKN